MSRVYKPTLFFSLLLTAIFGCDDNFEEIENVEIAGALGGNSSATGAADLGTTGYAPGNPTDYLELRWKNAVKGTLVADSMLILAIKNLTTNDYEVEVGVLFTGFVDKQTTLDMGRKTLDAGAEILVSVPTDDIPFQTTTGACQAHGRATPYDIKTGKQASFTHGSKHVFYTHSSDYSSLNIFDEKVLINDKNGLLTGIPTAITSDMLDKGINLGRIKNSSGTFEAVTTKDSSLTKTLNGKTIGTIIEMGMGYAMTDENGKIVKVNHVD